MIDLEKRSTKSTQKLLYPKPSLSKKKSPQKSLLSTWNQATSPQYSDSFLSRTETDSSIHSNDRFDSSSNVTVEYRQRNQLSHLLSLDFVQSSASFIYPNIRTISLGYIPNGKTSIYIFSNTLSTNKSMPFVFLGSEYFLRKSIDFNQLKYPLSTNEHLEPLIDLFLNRPQFIREIPQLNDLSGYRCLPQSISGLIFFDSSFSSCARHLCSEYNSKENQNKFTIKDLFHLSQRENHIIQINALNDKRYHALKNQLSEIYTYQSSIEIKPSQTSSIVIQSISHLRMKNLPAIVTSIVS